VHRVDFSGCNGLHGVTWRNMALHGVTYQLVKDSQGLLLCINTGCCMGSVIHVHRAGSILVDVMGYMALHGVTWRNMA
jgi:hypothetical protein